MKQVLTKALMLTLLATLARADEPAKRGVDYQVLTLEELLKVRIPTVSAASKMAEKATEAPATVVVITRSDIRLRGYRNLRDVFRDLPGMESIGFFYGEFGDLVPVRGVTGNNKIVALVNGMRVNPPGGEPMMFRGDFAIADVEQIEVIYGPGSTLYGQDAISAVVNVITRKPEEKAFQASLEGGTLNRKEGSLSFARAVGSATVTAYVQYLDRDRTDLSQAYPEEWARNVKVAQPKGSGVVPESEDCGMNAFLRVEAGDSSLQVWHRRSNMSSSVGQPPNFAHIAEAVWDDMSTVVEAKNNLDLSPATALESSVTFNRYETDPRSRYVFDNGAGGWNLTDFKYALGYSAAVEEKLTVKVNDRFSLVGGLVGSHYDIVPKATIPGGADRNRDIVAQGGFFTYYTRKGDATSRVDVARANNVVYQSLGAYLEGRFKPTDRLKLIAGARVDKDTRFDQVPFSPRFAAIYDLSGRLALKYVFTRAFVSPAPYFVYNVFANPVILNVINPGMLPETATSNEVNLLFSRDDLSAGVSVYYNRQNNLIVLGKTQLPVNVVRPEVWLDPAGTQRRVLTQTANAGQSTAKGLDVYSRARLGKASIWASYSFVDFVAELGAQKRGLDGISSHNFRLGTTYAVRDDLFATLSVGVRSTPENLLTLGNLGEEVKTPYEANLHVVYSPVRRLDVTADVRNLTDHRYALSGSALNASPQETFRAALGLRVAF